MGGPEKIEKSEQNTPKTLQAMVNKMWYDFNKVAPYIAEAVWVCTKKEYNDALDIYKKKTPEQKKKFDSNDLHTKYNLKIKEKVEQMFQKGEKLNLWELDDSTLAKFPSSKQEILKKYCDVGQQYENFAPYIKQMDDKQKEVLSEVPDNDFDWFIREKAQEGKNRIENLWKPKLAPTMEQIANVAELDTFYNDIAQIKKNHPDVFWTTHENIVEMQAAMSPEQKDSYAQAFGDSDEAIYKALQAQEDIKTIEQYWLRDKMSSEEQKKYDILVKRYYEYSESIWLGNYLKEAWGNFYDKVKNMVVEYKEKVTTSPIDTLKNEVIEDDSVKEYFTKYMDVWNVQDSDKDFEYYMWLTNIYPILQKDPKIQTLIKKDNLTVQEKEELKTSIQSRSKWSDAEGDLLEETRGEVRKQAITSSLDMLRIYMDIDVSEEENVLEQMEKTLQHTIESQQKNSDIILEINGNIQGKYMKIYYNLTTGKLQQEEFLSRGTINTPYAIHDSEKGKKDIPSVQLPRLDDFIEGAKGVNYANLVRKSKDLLWYKTLLWQEIQQQVKKEWTRDMDVEKMRCERNILKNIVSQETFLFMEQNIDESIGSFSKENNEKVYDMYTLLYDSFGRYTIDDLKEFRKNIALLTASKKKYLQYQKESWKNNAKYALSILGESDIGHVEWKKRVQENEYEQSEYKYIWKYADFFAIFRDTTYSRPIIDPISFKKFTYNVWLEMSNDQAYFIRDDMKRKFNEFVHTDDTEISLQASLDEAYA